MENYFSASIAHVFNSIIVGLCCAKVWGTVVHHIRYREKVIFYTPYLLHMVQMHLFLLTQLLIAPKLYEHYENNGLMFLVTLNLDMFGVLYTFLSLPSDELMNRNIVDLKEFYIETIPIWYGLWFSWCILGGVLLVDVFPERRHWGIIFVFLIELINLLGMLKWRNVYFHCVVHSYYLFGILSFFMGEDLYGNYKAV